MTRRRRASAGGRAGRASNPPGTAWKAVLHAMCCVAGLLGIASCRRAEEPAPVAESPQGIATKTGAEMVLVPAGRFRMGSTAGKPDEAPVHEVAADTFLMDRTEVTQEQYARLVVANPSHFKAPDRPVEQVSWADAALYCNLRSRDEGLDPCYDEKTTRCNFRANGYRLPTEAEWEYACRAGSDEAYSFGIDERQLKQFAWYAENSSKKTQPVAHKKPNAWGLFDMHGNVAEWCNDVYEPDYYRASPADNPTGPADGEKYVLRGGAWNSTAGACRAAARVGEDPGFQDACFARDAIGFRCVRRAAAAAKTGLVTSDIYLRHDTGQGHPERPQRLTAIVERLEAQGLLSRLERLKPSSTAEPWLTTVHTAAYVERIQAACREGIATVDSRDTPVSRESYEAAVAAVGGVIAAVDAVIDGKVRNAFCAVRPPGHHAMKDRAMGFCLFNNVAIAARYAMKKHNLKRVLIVDWDVHHGNGTQAAFNDDPSVLYFSVHQHPFYPGTGTADEKGEGKGFGTKINVPLPAGSGDEEYQNAFQRTLRPAALAFQPELVLVSAGFDAYEHDLLGRMKVTPQGFAELTRIVKAIADQCCRGRLVSVLEGGYQLDGLAACVEAHLRTLIQ